MVESFHLDTVMAVMLHVGQRDGVSHRGLNWRYFSIVAVSAIALGLAGLYLFMAHCVSRLTETYGSAVVVKVEHMKGVKYRFWLEDKKPDGNFFQRHFNLVLLLKDVYISTVLYCLYEQPLVLVVLLVLMQLPLTGLAIRFPPYLDSKDNRLLCITQCLYLLLNLLFFLNIAAADRMSAKARYYVVGFMMIAIVLSIILANIGFSMFKTYQSLKAKCKARRKLRVSAAGTKSSSDTLYAANDQSSTGTTALNSSLVETRKKKPLSQLLTSSKASLTHSSPGNGLNGEHAPPGDPSLVQADAATDQSGAITLLGTEQVSGEAESYVRGRSKAELPHVVDVKSSTRPTTRLRMKPQTNSQTSPKKKKLVQRVNVTSDKKVSS